MDHHGRVSASASLEGKDGAIFSLSRARRALVLVRRIASDAVSVFAHILQIQQMLESVQRCAPAEQIARLQHEMFVAADRFQEYVEELQQVGVDLRDPQRGEVDFPTFLEGRMASLCWRLGEKDITHWHERAGQCSRRRPITEPAGT